MSNFGAPPSRRSRSKPLPLAWRLAVRVARTDAGFDDVAGTGGVSWHTTTRWNRSRQEAVVAFAFDVKQARVHVAAGRTEKSTSVRPDRSARFGSSVRHRYRSFVLLGSSGWSRGRACDGQYGLAPRGFG